MSQADKKGPPDGPEAPQDENQIIAERRAKLRLMRERGPAYPNDFRRNAFAGALHEARDGETNDALEAAPVAVAVAGRMMLKRVMGKASFATLQDMSGRIQLYITNDATGDAVHAAFKHWDLGDIVGAEGSLFKTRTGELSVKVTALRLLCKALRPLPEKFHGLADQEQKYRQREQGPRRRHAGEDRDGMLELRALDAGVDGLGLGGLELGLRLHHVGLPVFMGGFAASVASGSEPWPRTASWKARRSKPLWPTRPGWPASFARAPSGRRASAIGSTPAASSRSASLR